MGMRLLIMNHLSRLIFKKG